ncbi:hypothetical protein [Tateyamaria sp. SN3-11]|uniref:hypothetical protein n=1 Tax=Tateyamaria sp. SN3-11 TaxID=3092147 RepID=UPI0039E85D49
MDDDHQRDGQVIKRLRKHGIGRTTLALQRGNLGRQFCDLLFHDEPPCWTVGFVRRRMHCATLAKVNHDRFPLATLFLTEVKNSFPLVEHLM